MAEVKGVVADIQRASFHDGEGIRTTVFLKGCPLSCLWCHNPECISFQPEILYYPEKCIGCGHCEEGCYAGAKVLCGREMTAAQVMDEVRQDIPYYGRAAQAAGQTSGGGLTISGGEPLAQPDFVKELLTLARAEGISCAVETSLIFYDEEIFRQLDFVMADLKIWDSAVHRQYTGAGNGQIIENFRRLNSLGIPVIARTPVLPEVDQGIEKISDFLKTLDNVVRYELLPYHPMGLAKLKALRREGERFSIPSQADMEEKSRYAYIR